MTTKTIRIGDRVRLIRLNGSVSDEVVTVHDIWGSDDHARNASFMSGGHEDLWHTELMRREDDTSPVTVPDGGEWFIARGNNLSWGRARTMPAAIANMRRQGGKITAFVVHRVSKWTAVDGMGSLTYPMGIEPVEVKRVTSKTKAVA